MRSSLITHLPCQTCRPGCAGVLRQFGQDVAEQLERIPATYKVIQQVGLKLACERLLRSLTRLRIMGDCFATRRDSATAPMIVDTSALIAILRSEADAAFSAEKRDQPVDFRDQQS